MLSHHTSLTLACLVLGGGLAAQRGSPQDPSVDIESRVARCLEGLEKADSFVCKTTTTTQTPSFLRQLRGAGKETKRSLLTVREGQLTCWSKDAGDQVLARAGSRWVMLDRDGDWIPVMKPEGAAWKSQHLADPSFLAGRLLHLMKKTKWTSGGSKTIGDKATRSYKCTLELDEASHLVRTGALSEGGGMIGGMMLMAGGIGGGGVPEPDRKIEIELLEDPATKLPVEITARVFSEGGMMGNVKVAIGGLGGQAEEVEEEEADDAEKKPSATLVFTLSKYGEAKASDLSKPARAVLGLIR